MALPAIQAEFGVTRPQASLPYTVTMVGFGFGGILMGRLADRHGVMIPVLIGIAALGLGFIGAGLAPSLLTFSIAQCLLIGALGNAATFVPLVADTSMWFTRRRGIAIAICASGNYVPAPSGRRSSSTTSTSSDGGRRIVGVGVFSISRWCRSRSRCAVGRPALVASGRSAPSTHRSDQPLGFSPGALQALLCLAGSPAAWRCRCRRCISSPTAAIWGSVRPRREMLSLMLASAS